MKLINIKLVKKSEAECITLLLSLIKCRGSDIRATLESVPPFR